MSRTRYLLNIGSDIKEELKSLTPNGLLYFKKNPQDLTLLNESVILQLARGYVVITPNYPSFVDFNSFLIDNGHSCLLGAPNEELTQEQASEILLAKTNKLNQELEEKLLVHNIRSLPNTDVVCSEGLIKYILGGYAKLSDITKEPSFSEEGIYDLSYKIFEFINNNPYSVRETNSLTMVLAELLLLTKTEGNENV